MVFDIDSNCLDRDLVRDSERVDIDSEVSGIDIGGGCVDCLFDAEEATSEDE